LSSHSPKQDKEAIKCISFINPKHYANGMFSAVTPEDGKTLDNALDVSSYASKPYKSFSPFTYSPDFKIPVPGQEGVYACSVESVWQGLKLIGGAADFEMFTRMPEKRKGEVQGHEFNGKVLNPVSARINIYKPTYLFYVEHHVPSETKESVLELALKKGISFYDIESNLDIEDTSAPLAHSAILKTFFEDYLVKRKEEAKAKIDKAYNPQENHETLAEALARALHSFSSSSEVDKKLIKLILSQNNQDLDRFEKRYHVHLLEKIKEL